MTNKTATKFNRTMNVSLIWKPVTTTCPNQADVAGAPQISKTKKIHMQGVKDKYSISEEFIKENSLLLLAVVYLSGEFNTGIRYSIKDIVSIV
jgi:hypothetical protein